MLEYYNKLKPYLRHPADKRTASTGQNVKWRGAAELGNYRAPTLKEFIEFVEIQNSKRIKEMERSSIWIHGIATQTEQSATSWKKLELLVRQKLIDLLSTED